MKVACEHIQLFYEPISLRPDLQYDAWHCGGGGIGKEYLTHPDKLSISCLAGSSSFPHSIV